MKTIIRIGRGVPAPRLEVPPASSRFTAVSAFLLRCLLVLILAIAISLGQIIDL